jgi:Cu(I)/Ag(I) efflux system membrane protein CusA/SilA
MLIYLDHAYAELQGQRAMEGRPFSHDDLYAAIMSGAVERVRPKMMTVFAIMAGLLPIMWSHGTGAAPRPPRRTAPRSPPWCTPPRASRADAA